MPEPFDYAQGKLESKANKVKRYWRWYVYIIECEDNLYYTGLTWRPNNRWVQHLSGVGSKFTSKHKPIKVVYSEEYDDLEQARRREKQIKGWTKREKEKLIKGEWGKY